MKIPRILYDSGYAEVIDQPGNSEEIEDSLIWHFQQNNPELIVEDARRFLELSEEQCEGLRFILKARGVNKWFLVRRILIRYKDVILREIQYRHKKIHQRVGGKRELSFLKIELRVLEAIRKDIRFLCHSERNINWPKSSSARVTKAMGSFDITKTVLGKLRESCKHFMKSDIIRQHMRKYGGSS
ncbi:MAG: hypothetical protein GY861_20940 [bacterium]|nr:hypothetical protein [bacterium]